MIKTALQKEEQTTKNIVGLIQEYNLQISMMSPLSVSTYLPRNGVHFDLVIMDEASLVQRTRWEHSSELPKP
jgi:superfamily I DNA and/or RNA helicase